MTIPISQKRWGRWEHGPHTTGGPHAGYFTSLNAFVTRFMRKCSVYVKDDVGKCVGLTFSINHFARAPKVLSLAEVGG